MLAQECGCIRPAHEVEKNRPHFPCLPTEIIQMILTYLPTQDLAHNVQMTCKTLRNLTFSVYRHKYGQGPTPLAQDTNSYWQKFALRNEEYQRVEHRVRDQVIEGFLESYFELPSDEKHMKEAEDVLYYLHDNPWRHTNGIEAIIVALNIQWRREESREFLLDYGDSDAISLNDKALLQARFSLDFSVTWSDCPIGVLNDCLSAAAASGNTDLFMSLKELVLQKGQDTKFDKPAVAAARSGTVEALQHLQASVDFDSHPLPRDLMIEEAAKSNHINIIQYLLDIGGPTNLDDPYKFALDRGNIDVLHQLANHSPGIAGTYFPNGELQIVFTMDNRKAYEAIEFLVKYASADINAIGKDGLAAVHVAAERGRVDVLKILRTLGANMISPGDVEQTPAEFAYCNGHDISFISPIPEPIRPLSKLLELKRNLAKVILRKSRDRVIRYFMAKSKKNRFDHRAYEDVENRLADIWAKKIGIKTLQQMHSLLETPLFTTVENFRSIVMEYANSRMPRVTDDQLHDTRVIKDILKKSLAQQYPDSYLENLGYHVMRRLTLADIDHLKEFVNSKAGHAFHLRQRSFANEEIRIWFGFHRKIGIK